MQTNKRTCPAKKLKPDVLIIEGTRVDSNNSKKELEVEDEICGISSEAKGLSVGNWSVRDTDRMLFFLNAAKKLDKKLAISLKQAYLLDELAKCGDSIAPKTDDEELALYANRKSWGVIGDSNWCDKIRDEDYESWERPYLDRVVCYKDVRANQQDYLMFCSNFDLKELIDIKPVEGSVYIKSVCEPFDAEMEMDWERIMNWINHFGMKVESPHVSGHASGPQLREFVEQVNAATLFVRYGHLCTLSFLIVHLFVSRNCMVNHHFFLGTAKKQKSIISSSRTRWPLDVVW